MRWSVGIWQDAWAKRRTCSIKVFSPKGQKTKGQGGSIQAVPSAALTALLLQNEDVFLSAVPVCRNKTRWQKPRALHGAVSSPPTGCSLGNKWSRQLPRRVSSGFHMKMK